MIYADGSKVKSNIEQDCINTQCWERILNRVERFDKHEWNNVDLGGYTLIQTVVLELINIGAM
jgi:hypothetical protein